MELETRRLLLREFRADDHAAVHAFGGDPEVVRYAEWGPNTPDETTQFLADMARLAAELPRRAFTLGVVDRADGALIGVATISVVSDRHRRGEMGYALRRSRWGQGFATEAAEAVLRFGFAGLGLHRVVAMCDPDNVASVRVLTKIGMHREGYLREHLYVRGEWRDRLLFGALATGG